MISTHMAAHKVCAHQDAPARGLSVSVPGPPRPSRRGVFPRHAPRHSGTRATTLCPPGQGCAGLPARAATLALWALQCGGLVFYTASALWARTHAARAGAAGPRGSGLTLTRHPVPLTGLTASAPPRPAPHDMPHRFPRSIQEGRGALSSPPPGAASATLTRDRLPNLHPVGPAQSDVLSRSTHARYLNVHTATTYEGAPQASDSMSVGRRAQRPCALRSSLCAEPSSSLLCASLLGPLRGSLRESYVHP